MNIRKNIYIKAIKIRGAARSIGNGFKKHFLTGDKEQTNYAVTDYIQRRTLLTNEGNCIKGIQLEWKEVRIGDDCAKNTAQTTTTDESSTSSRGRKDLLS